MSWGPNPPPSDCVCHGDPAHHRACRHVSRGPAHGHDRVSSPAVSPSKEIKTVSAARRSSMGSCGSGGYFSSSPTLSNSPPVLCNPKSGEWRAQPVCPSLGDAGARGLR